jgi:hypothetical protein
MDTPKKEALNEPLVNPSINNRDNEDDQERQAANKIDIADSQSTVNPAINDKIDTSYEMLKKISSLAIYPIIGMVFHPAYIIYNTMLFNDRPKEQNAMAVGGIVLSLSLLSLGVTFNGALDTLIP